MGKRPRQESAAAAAAARFAEEEDEDDLLMSGEDGSGSEGADSDGSDAEGAGAGSGADEQVDDEEVAEEALAAGLIGGAGGGSAARAAAVNNKAALRAAFHDVAQDLPWIERLEVVSADPLGLDSVKDDLKVELAFYSQALAAVSAARGELERLGVPHRRPDDYLAEMLKSDDHMKRIKDKLLLEGKKLTAVEARRRQKEAEAFRKGAAAEKARARAAEKRGALDAVKQWKKHRGETGGGGDAALEAMLDGPGAGGGFAPGKGGPRDRKDGPGGSRKRLGKDAKYGFGGPKRDAKANSAKSSRDMAGFSARRMKAPPKGLGGGGGGGGGFSGGGFKGGAKGGAKGGFKGKGAPKGGARPGKSARMARKGGGARR